jgi:hypothetical protein
MADNDGPNIARWVYATLLQSDTVDLDDIPYALDAAVKRLRESSDEVTPHRWATYIHIGA